MAIKMFAAIDVGSFELEMGIYEISQSFGIRQVDHVRHVLALGRETYNDRKISYRLVEEMCQVLKSFSEIMKSYRVTDYRAYATSAMREAKNSQIVLEQIRVRTGLTVKSINNSELRLMTYKAVASKDAAFHKIVQKGTAIIDVGFGSTQISLFDKDALVTTQSLKMGSVRIRQRLKELEKTNTNYAQLVEEFIRNDLTGFKRLYLKDREIKNLILMGDFLTETIFREERQDNIITRAEFEKRYENTVYKTETSLSEEMDIDPEYAALIVPTMVICKDFMDLFNAEALWMPGVSLLDGIAYDFGEKKNFIKSAHNFENDILVAAHNIAKRYSTGKDHIKGTTELALAIFDSMKKVHGMGDRERLLLQIAVQLHDCGKYISMGDVAECSYRIIMATEIIGLSTEERQIIANAVRYNTTEFVYYQEIAGEIGMDRSVYLLIAKLTAILRIANAMDRSHYQKVKNMKAVLKDRTLLLTVDSEQDISLELGLLMDKVDGCMITACLSLYKTTGDEKYLKFSRDFIDWFVQEDGSIKTYDPKEYNLDNVNQGKNLFILYDIFGDEKYRKAIDTIRSQLLTQPRTKEGNFWHKDIYPWQVWLDGTYMAQPFYMEYETRYNKMQGCIDSYKQFMNIQKHMRDEKTGLYYHGYDESRQMYWADPVTGCSPNFWLRAMGWFMVAMVDVLERMDEQLYNEYRGIMAMFKQTIEDVHKFQDEETGMFWQVMDHPGVEGNYLETSGTALFAYAVLKGVRLGYLPKRMAAWAEKAFYGTCDKYLSKNPDGSLQLDGICLVAGLGGKDHRDGSLAYYFSEPVVCNDAKGVGPLVLAYTEMIARK